MVAGTKIFTIGHGGLSRDEFLRRLQTHGIAALADVRRFPTSKRHPHFSRAALSAALNEQGIVYHWLGEKLGGYRSEGYETYTNTEDFQQGCKELIHLAELQPLAFMCAELDYHACHRRFIAAYLQQQDFEVLHIDKSGGLSAHAETETGATMQIPF
jgi:uncharacterized protein (DUF488 family)